jgi:predicted ribosomally synthesized peptide with SipW-like signal peptide
MNQIMNIMSYKRIMMSIAVIVAVGAGVAGVTGAFYSDTETSEGNIFTAGSIDLKVDHLKQTYNGVDCETCSVNINSSTNTQVVGSNDAASNDGPFPQPASEVENPHSNWADENDHLPAQWIWEDSSTDPGDTQNDAEYTFEDTFDWFGTVAGLNLDLGLGADDGYKIVLNGTTIVDELDEGYNHENVVQLTTGQKTDFKNTLVQGENVLQITVRNHAGSSNPDNNPAGLLYAFSIQNEDCEDGVGDFQQQCQLWGETDLDGSQTFFNFGDIKPGDNGSNVISLHVFDNDAYSCLLAHDGQDDENTVHESEGDDDDTAGEVQNYINFFAWTDDNADGVYDSGETALGQSTLGNLGSIASYDSGNGQFLTGTTTEYIGLSWCAGDISENNGVISCDGAGMLNDAQSDSFSASLTAYAVQTRNNEQFSCGDIDASELPEYVAPTNSDLN